MKIENKLNFIEKNRVLNIFGTVGTLNRAKDPLKDFFGISWAPYSSLLLSSGKKS
jgi:hypothetical protein